MSRNPKILLVLALVAVVLMAFRVSWNALRDVARAIGADHTAAVLYPLVVDGLMGLALVASLVLSASDRKFALRVLAGYTAASLVLNYDHGMVAAIQSGSRVHLADWSPANWALMLLATSLPVGSIAFGADLVAKVLHHQPDPDQSAQTTIKGSGSDLDQSADPAPVESVYLAPVLPPAAVPAAAPAVIAAAAPAPVLASVPVAVSRPRRATGTVPTAAKNRQPTRTPAELLDEARSATAGWPDAHLTADRIRAEVHTSSVNARTLRDALKAERGIV
ncbi:DUF2637 domain-containing protein [Streptacidiphilus sp. N1-12]|uniref:DUF2637 domain-containing protein n=2 Tax=Streptacidiphilus alkalitolerans TaxID=3342712 RepID=A0ABV6V652_9ACTN